MATERPIAEYNCTMAVLYVIARMSWTSHSDNQQDFTDFSTNYDATNTTSALAEIDAAAAMPMFQSRNDATEESYVLLKQAAKESLRKWRYLRNYIRAGFAPELRKTKWESAGKDHYEKATNNSWGELLLLLEAGNEFIANNGPILSGPGGMPAAFAGDYATARTAFSTLHGQFLSAEQDEVEATDAKTLANNAVYRRMMDMNEDGQLIYEDNAAKRKRFIFQQLKNLVTQPSGNVSATSIIVSGILSNAETAAPLPNMPMEFSSPDGSLIQTVVTDDTGRYVLEVTGLSPDAAFELQIAVNLPTFEPALETLPVEAGESYVEDIEVTPLPAE